MQYNYTYAVAFSIFPILLVLGVVSYSLKRRALGGWLLFFCGQTYLSATLSLVRLLARPNVYLLAPGMKLDKYLALLVVTFAPVAAAVTVAVFVTLLLIEREWDAVVRLRYGILAYLLSNGLAFLVDVKYFPLAAYGRVSAMITIGVWLRYFHASDRVESVFLRKDWNSGYWSAFR